MVTQRKRILFIAPQPFFEVRGTPIATRDMLMILSQEYQIDLLTYPFGVDEPLAGVQHFRSASLGFKSVSIGASLRKFILDLSLFWSALKLSFRDKYDVIHVVEEAVIVGILLKRISRVKLVYDMDSIMSEHAESKTILSRILKMVERSGIKNSDLILGVSGNFEKYCRAIKPDCNFVEIWDVPHIEKLELPTALKQLFVTPNKKIVYIGNGEKYQGLNLLQEAAHELPEYDFFIIGTKRNEKVENITYIPAIEMKYVWGVMQLADVLISPRLQGTNTPMKIYTYMMSEKPIVATDIPAHNILKVQGCTLAKTEPKAMAEAVRASLSSSTQCDYSGIMERLSEDRLKETVLRSYARL